MGWLAAIISGILAGLSYPTRFGPYLLPDFGFLAFFCWVPLFQVVARVPARRAFFYSFVAALVHYYVAQFWLYRAIHSFGGLPPVTAFLVMSLLFLVLAIYFGSIFALSQWVSDRLRIPVFYLRAFFWVGIEYLRHYWPAGGYPWSQLGYTQSGFLTFIQSADIISAYGITFLLVLINEAVSLLVSRIRKKPVPSLKWPVMIVMTLVAVNLGYGWYRFHQTPVTPIENLSLGIVQGNIPQEEKWQRGKSRYILQIFLEGSKKLEAQGADLILWPEASFPYTVAYDLPRLPFSLELERSQVLLGAISRSRDRRHRQPQRTVYNSAILLTPEGAILDYYHKGELVPFGEYVPYADILFFAKKLVAEVGNIQAGQEFRPIRYRDFQLGILICYEDIFPYISREMVRKGANGLVNITNDAWYGFSSAAYQHQAYSQMRSVETRRALIRATNTGISSLVDRYGRVVWQGGLYTREDFLSQFPLYDDETIYVKIGDVLPKASLAVMGMLILWSFSKRRA